MMSETIEELMPVQPNLRPEQISNALALELAAQLTDLPDILSRYSLTNEQLKRILKDPEFRIMYAQAKARWGADTNAAERVTTKSTMLVEDSLLEIYGMIHDKDSSMGSKIQAFNALVELSEVSPKRQAAGNGVSAGDKFSITINLSGGPRQYEINNASRRGRPPKADFEEVLDVIDAD